MYIKIFKIFLLFSYLHMYINSNWSYSSSSSKFHFNSFINSHLILALKDKFKIIYQAKYFPFSPPDPCFTFSSLLSSHRLGTQCFWMESGSGRLWQELEGRRPSGYSLIIRGLFLPPGWCLSVPSWKGQSVGRACLIATATFSVLLPLQAECASHSLAVLP